MTALRAGIAGWSVLLPAVATDDDAPASVEPTVAEREPTAADAATVLGRKGLINKVPATRLALVTAHRALGLPPGIRPQSELDPRLAVVGCSTMGNADAVLEILDDVTNGGLRAVSPLNAPNASANVLASSVALRYGAGGPNLMVVDAVDGGAHALRHALRLLAADRADRVLLVGAEAAGRADALHGPALTTGAACLLLTRGDTDLELTVEPCDERPGGSAELGSVDQLIALATAVGGVDRSNDSVSLTLGGLVVRIGAATSASEDRPRGGVGVAPHKDTAATSASEDRPRGGVGVAPHMDTAATSASEDRPRGGVGVAPHMDGAQ